MTIETYTYDKENELKIDIHFADVQTDNIYLYFHGGGLENGGREDDSKLCEQLCANGITVITVDYRLYPQAVFPNFIEDAANAVCFVMQKFPEAKLFVGGSSAGAYISMMLLFDKRYLRKYGVDPFDIDGWILDAGQPTTHYNVLRERGLDTRLIRVDEAAPIYFINNSLTHISKEKVFPRVVIITSSNDIPCRYEQLKMLQKNLQVFGWPEDKLLFEYMNGYSHCAYVNDVIYAEKLVCFIKNT